MNINGTEYTVNYVQDGVIHATTTDYEGPEVVFASSEIDEQQLRTELQKIAYRKHLRAQCAMLGQDDYQGV